ncbi:Sterol 24-C-methyltransferase erg-4 [Cytospora mali]|uniref:Sterol 24-C-methyltransferase n=1 Tax=Cytospora mali TaxID=578113 RepID=A0A194VWN6_CYTMA|nr:Sterol 24-C-methyltransferase erg-4 [Valsa mali]
MDGESAKEAGASSRATSSAFDKILHRGYFESQGALRAILRKDKASHRVAVGEYFQHWDGKDAEHETDVDRRARAQDYAGLSRQYYNLTTDIFEHAWGESFHFCRFAHGESFSQAIARHEHYLAASIGIRSDMRVLDVGCGVGGPAREMVKFTGCHVTGLNISEYQLEHARTYGERDGLSHRLDFVKGDFMSMPFPDASFDAVYAIEATVHAPSHQGVYNEIRRVLKPGGRFGLYEWVMTDDYDNENIDHRRIRLDIEQGYGIATMGKMSDVLVAMDACGLELEVHRDLAVNEDKLDVAPWYWPMGTDMKHAQTVWDVLSLLKKNRWGAILTAGFLGLLEAVGIAPAGTKKTADSMGKGADALVAGGMQGLFTPMFLLVGKRPDV